MGYRVVLCKGRERAAASGMSNAAHSSKCYAQHSSKCCSFVIKKVTAYQRSVCWPRKPTDAAAETAVFYMLWGGWAFTVKSCL